MLISFRETSLKEIKMSIKIIYSNKHTTHNPPYEIYDGVKESYAEKVERLAVIVKSLKETQAYTFISPKRFSIRYIEDLHSKIYIDFLRKRSLSLNGKVVLYPSFFIRDTYAPITRGTFEAARCAVDVALTGAEMIQNGESIIYCLCRPPGHHAECNAMGGYCYFNNAAIAADYLSRKGRVAILDIDFHHGNGTQNLFYERDDILYVSLHADPKVKFPYTSGFADEKGKEKGLGFNKNYPLPSGIDDSAYLKVLKRALRDVVQFNPKYLVVSLGFDTYEKDPIGGFKLTVGGYNTIAQKISLLHLPVLLIQEGGYYVNDLGKIALSFLKGYQR